MKMKTELFRKIVETWRATSLLLLLLLLATAPAFAQMAVCAGKGFMLTSKADAESISGGVTYTWHESFNGGSTSITNSNTAALTIAAGKSEAGTYAYVRMVAGADCGTPVPSNTYTVVVYNCVLSDGVSATATFIDPRDGKPYKVVRMPDNRIWFAQNLNYQKDLTWNEYSVLANGSSFTSIGSGAPAIGSYWCPGASEATSSSSATCDVYGALYTWETAMMPDGKGTWTEAGSSSCTGAPNSDECKINFGRSANSGTDISGRGICPPGWHVPTDYEWAVLLDKVEGNPGGAGASTYVGTSTTFTNQTNFDWNGTNAGTLLKSAGTCTGNYCATDTDPSWTDNDNRGTDLYGFSVLPSGDRSNNGSSFGNRGVNAHFWSSSVYSGQNAWIRGFNYNQACVYRSYYDRSLGFSVRCLRDS